MIELFNSLEPLQKFFWTIACCASLVFIIQTIMTFIGLGTDADVDAGPMDGSVDSMEDGALSGVFSFRNLINFLLGYGWAGVLLFALKNAGCSSYWQSQWVCCSSWHSCSCSVR